jgi:hypothetical protein
MAHIRVEDAWQIEIMAKSLPENQQGQFLREVRRTLARGVQFPTTADVDRAVKSVLRELQPPRKLNGSHLKA